MVQRCAAWLTAISFGPVASVALGMAIGWVFPAQAAEPGKTYLYAASSLQLPLEKVVAAYSQKTGYPVVLVSGSSGDLARQIEQGAPAGLFIPANVEWLDYLQSRNLTQTGSRRNLLGNRLVAVSSPCSDRLEAPIAELLEQAKDSRIAMANPATAPAGVYAKQALITLGLWQRVERRAAYAEDVRAALNWVARCESHLGFVYKTDALAGKTLGLRIAAEFPDGSHTPIVYPLVIIAAYDTPQARDFAAYLSNAQSFAIFESFGFIKPGQ